MFVSPPNSHIEILTPEDDCVMKCVRHKVKVLNNGASAFIRENPERSVASFLHVKTEQEGALMQVSPLLGAASAVVLILDFQNPEL